MRYLLRLQNLSQYYWDQLWEQVLQGSRHDPLQLVELTMLCIALLLVLLLITGLCQDWPFWVLSLSYACGAACSALVRESLFPSPLTCWVRLSALLLLITSGYGFFELAHYI